MKPSAWMMKQFQDLKTIQISLNSFFFLAYPCYYILHTAQLSHEEVVGVERIMLLCFQPC